MIWHWQLIHAWENILYKQKLNTWKNITQLSRAIFPIKIILLNFCQSDRIILKTIKRKGTVWHTTASLLFFKYKQIGIRARKKNWNWGMYFGEGSKCVSDNLLINVTCSHLKSVQEKIFRKWNAYFWAAASIREVHMYMLYLWIRAAFHQTWTTCISFWL